MPGAASEWAAQRAAAPAARSIGATPGLLQICKCNVHFLHLAAGFVILQES